MRRHDVSDRANHPGGGASRGCLPALVLRKSPSGLRKDFGWQCEGLRHAVQRTAHGWTAELAIPFESLMPGSAHRQAWRCNFYRIDRPKGESAPELTAWSPTGLPQFHVTERFGYLIFAD